MRLRTAGAPLGESLLVTMFAHPVIKHVLLYIMVKTSAPRIIIKIALLLGVGY